MSGATQSRPTQRALDGWDCRLRRRAAFSTPEQNPALGVLSTPAHPQVSREDHTGQAANR